jgi:hypothetical protein
MKYSKKPRHYAPRKHRHGFPLMPNSTAPGHHSMGGQTLFNSFADALTFILTAGKFGRRKEALKPKEAK